MGNIGDGYIVGGIAGGAGGSGSVLNCYNIGNINCTGNSCTGGIVSMGETSSSSELNIKYCYNAGDVTNENGYAGGIIGNAGGNIEYCYNLGDVLADSQSGGIVGQRAKSISHCYNSGNVEGRKQTYTFLGGISGLQNTTISDCHNTGKIISPETEYPEQRFIGEIFGNTQGSNTVGPDCTYLLRDDGTNAPSNGATGKTTEEMEEIMSIQNFVNALNTQIRENNANPDNVQLNEWTVKDGKPVLIWE